MATTGGREYFGMWLSRTMAGRDMSAAEVARALGIKDGMVSRWRRGQNPPSAKYVEALAGLFDVDPIRLAVTAGLFQPGVVNSKPLDLPPETARREAVKAVLAKIPGVTPRERRVILEAFDAAQEDDG